MPDMLPNGMASCSRPYSQSVFPRLGPFHNYIYRLLVYRSLSGPVIGGSLAQPTQRWPTLFLPGSTWDRYPFLLPNLAVAVLLTLTSLLGALCLSETRPDFKHKVNWNTSLRSAVYKIINKMNAFPSKYKVIEVNDEIAMTVLAPETQDVDELHCRESLLSPAATLKE